MQKSVSARTCPFSPTPATECQTKEYGVPQDGSPKPALPPRVSLARPSQLYPEQPPRRKAPMPPPGMTLFEPGPKLLLSDLPPQRSPQTPYGQTYSFMQPVPPGRPPERLKKNTLNSSPEYTAPGRPPERLKKHTPEDTAPGRPPERLKKHTPEDTAPERPPERLKKHIPEDTAPGRPPERLKKHTLNSSPEDTAPGRPPERAVNIPPRPPERVLKPAPGSSLERVPKTPVRPPDRFLKTHPGRPLESTLQTSTGRHPESDFSTSQVRPEEFLKQPSPESFLQSPIERNQFHSSLPPSPRVPYNRLDADSSSSLKWRPGSPLGASVPTVRGSYFNTNRVVNLKALNYHDFVKRHEKALIMFFHSNQRNSILPSREFAKAAEGSQKENHVFAGVDCAVEKELCNIEEVCNLPMLKLYSNGFDLSTVRCMENLNAHQMQIMVTMSPVLTQPRKNINMVN